MKSIADVDEVFFLHSPVDLPLFGMCACLWEGTRRKNKGSVLVHMIDKGVVCKRLHKHPGFVEGHRIWLQRCPARLYHTDCSPPNSQINKQVKIIFHYSCHNTLISISDCQDDSKIIVCKNKALTRLADL